MSSPFLDRKWVADEIKAGRHREVVGGMWDEIGELQFTFLVSQGLKPHHRFLDVGCGPLRGGVHFVRYLDPGHYFGLDLSQPLLEKGRDEVERLGLGDRLPAGNLLCTEQFGAEAFGCRFDFALAQSVFTHLNFNYVRQCLEKISEVLVGNGLFYATFFERHADTRASLTLHHEPGGITTHDVCDPYHYSARDLAYAAQDVPLEFRYIGGWEHPRAQKMVVFRKT